jgi:Holliday junction resolvase RusA-like endonuclease
MDCVTYTECIKDDSKIVKLLLEKFYADEDRIEIEINDICL